MERIPTDPASIGLDSSVAAMQTQSQLLQRGFTSAKQKLGKLSRSMELAQQKEKNQNHGVKRRRVALEDKLKTTDPW